MGECEISLDIGKNALRAYFSKTFYPTTGLTANIASVSEYSSDYGKSPGRENLHHTHTKMQTNIDIKPAAPLYLQFDLFYN